MDHLHHSLLNAFTAQPLDRCSLERKESDWLLAQLNNPRAEYLILDAHSVVTINRAPLIMSYDEFHVLNKTVIDKTDIDKATPMLLGLKKSDNTPVFVVNIIDAETSQSLTSSVSPNDKMSIENFSLREIANEIDPEIASMYSYATLINHWHISTRFCTRCGSSLEIKEGGSMQQCSNESCSHIEYPRINPAVIMRVTRGNKILLARQANWPEHRYSVLAGFVEVGETLEHAVEREVFEEVKIRVKNINYHSSQPWPFPNSFMLGYTAEADSDEFDIEQDDIDHALWLSAEELKTKMMQGIVLPPTDLSISFSLVNDWFEAETGTSLRDFKASLSL